jgi:hypothetical protein
MIKFDDMFQEEDKPSPPETYKRKNIDFNALVAIKPKLSASEEKALRDELHKIEPGYKVPVANYKQIGQWCDYCEDVYTHVLNEKGDKLRCLNCKKDKKVG